MAENAKDIPGVVAPPVAIYLGFLAVGFAGDYFFPLPLLPDGVQIVAGIFLIALGGIFAGLTLRQFHRAKTDSRPWKPSKAIVAGGPNKFSRNPIYLGMTLIFAGIAVAVDSVFMLALLVPTLLLMQYGVILREEAYLESKFGEEYLQYKGTVRRWI